MSAEPPPSPTGSVTLRFLAAPTDVAFLGGQAVAGGRVLEWVDKAAYACAVGWSASYCVTAYVGNVNFSRPIHSGDVVEATAQLVLTGRSSMHIQVSVRAAPSRPAGSSRPPHARLSSWPWTTPDGRGPSDPGSRRPMSSAMPRNGRLSESEFGTRSSRRWRHKHTQPTAKHQRRSCVSLPRRRTLIGAARPTAEPSCAGSMKPPGRVQSAGAAWSVCPPSPAASGFIDRSRSEISSKSAPGCCTPAGAVCTSPCTSAQLTPGSPTST